VCVCGARERQFFIAGNDSCGLVCVSNTNSTLGRLRNASPDLLTWG
jgi:hypothetical protein